MKQDLVYMLLLVLCAAVFAVFISPFLEAHGLVWISVLFYIVVVFTFVYGRSGMEHRLRRRNSGTRG